MRTITLSAAVLLTAGPAAFPFAHLWDIQEVYSNANGSVQFVEFFTTGTDEFFLSGVVLQAKLNGVPVNSYTFQSNLSGPTTGNRTFLVATATFETLYGITPDYIIPEDFLIGGANRTLDFGGFDEVSLANLPTDGVMSLNGIPNNDVPSATSLNSQATPRNFDGEQVTIPEPSAALFAIAGALGLLGTSRRSRRVSSFRQRSHSN
jgi:serralysin